MVVLFTPRQFKQTGCPELSGWLKFPAYFSCISEVWIFAMQLFYRTVSRKLSTCGQSRFSNCCFSRNGQCSPLSNEIPLNLSLISIFTNNCPFQTVFSACSDVLLIHLYNYTAVRGHRLQWDRQFSLPSMLLSRDARVPSCNSSAISAHPVNLGALLTHSGFMNSGANFLKNNTPRVAIGFFPCKTHCIQEDDED